MARSTPTEERAATRTEVEREPLLREVDRTVDDHVRRVGSTARQLAQPRRGRELLVELPCLETVGDDQAPIDRKQRLRYVFLSPQEEQVLRQMQDLGANVTAQDVPGSHKVELSELLESEASVQ